MQELNALKCHGGKVDRTKEIIALMAFHEPELRLKSTSEGMEVSVDGHSSIINKEKSPNTFLALQQLAIAIAKDKENAGT